MHFHGKTLQTSRFFTCILGIAFTSVTNSSAAQSDSWLNEWQRVQAQGRSSIFLDIDNDSLLLNLDDGFYTSGNHVQWSKSIADSKRSLAYGWNLGQDLYTSSNINLRPNQLSRYDHPYAGWLYLGVFREQHHADGSASTYAIDAGCFGPCAGGDWTQTNLHRLLQQPLPQAWSTQLKQEWGVVARADWTAPSWQLSPMMDVSTQAGVRVGNLFDDAKFSLSVRLGQLNALPSQSASYVFLRAEARAVAYNASLQGGYFRNQALALSPKRIVPEVEFGYRYQGVTWGLAASIIRRGNEIEQFINARGTQNFAKIQIRYDM